MNNHLKVRVVFSKTNLKAIKLELNIFASYRFKLLCGMNTLSSNCCLKKKNDSCASTWYFGF